MYTIGQISEMFHIPVSTLRYYDKELFHAIETLDKNLQLLTQKEVLTEMGFPSNWREMNN